MARKAPTGDGLHIPVDQLYDIVESLGNSTVEKHDSAAMQGMLRLMNVLEAKAVQLTPVDTGNLESSTHVSVQERGGIVVGVLRFGAPYAAEVHELPPERRGPKTAKKPGNEYGLAGAKYLERPLRGFQKEMGKGMADFIRSIWATKVRRRRR